MAQKTAAMMVVLASLVAIAGTARAQVLGNGACLDLLREHKSLIKLGVGKTMAKGPGWAKANLTPPQLALIKRYIDIGERLAFRCPAPEKLRQMANKPHRKPPPLPGRKPQVLSDATSDNGVTGGSQRTHDAMPGRATPKMSAKKKTARPSARPRPAPPLPVARAGAG